MTFNDWLEKYPDRAAADARCHGELRRDLDSIMHAIRTDPDPIHKAHLGVRRDWISFALMFREHERELQRRVAA